MKRKQSHKHKSVTVLPVTALFFALIIGFVLCVLLLAQGEPQRPSPTQSKLAGSISENLLQPLLRSTPTPIPSPTPKPYPPAGYHCVNVPILMYHHIQPLKEAATLGHASLTVDSEVFSSQMKYLSEKGYTPILLATLSEFFDGRAVLPNKPVIITVDDGYDDFFNYALPILESHGFRSDLFIPTGLMENPGYLTWSQIQSASTRGTAIDHHTWSHANVARNDDAFFTRELDGPTQQLLEKGYGPVHVFAYPYGTNSKRAVEEVRKRGFSIAVTTAPGRIQCKEDRLLLRRIRIGNASLSTYGL